MADVNGTFTLTDAGESISLQGESLYQVRWKVEGTQGQSGQALNVYIRERGYTGSVTTLATGSVPAEVQYTPIGQYGGQPWWNLAQSTGIVEFYDDETGLLQEIIAGDDEQFQLEFELDGSVEWRGFISPDSYRYKLYRKGLHEISGTDRLDLLYAIPYTQGGNVFYVGRATLMEVVSRCLDSTGLDIGFATHMNWYPHHGSNELTTSDDMLVNLRVDQDNFFDADDNPFSKGSVLEQILVRFQLQLYQAEGRWFLVQRKRNIIDDGGTDKFRVFQYSKTGAVDGPATRLLDARRNVAFSSTTENQILNTVVTGTVPIGKASITYYHGNPFVNLFDNLSFEDGLRDPVGGTPLVQGGSFTAGLATFSADGFTPSVNVPSGRKFTIAGDDTVYTLTQVADVDVGGATSLVFDPVLQAAPADNAALTWLDDQGGWLRSNANFVTANEGQGLEDDDVRALQLKVDYDTIGGLTYDEYVRQQSSAEFSGGTGLRMKTGWWVRVPGLSNVTTGFKHAFKMYITGASTTWYYKWSDTTWTTTDTTNEIDVFIFNFPDDTWQFINILTDELLDGSTAISGTLTIEFLEGKEIDPGSGTQQVTEYYIDNVVEPIIILSNGEPANEATQTLLTYTGNVNQSSPNTPTLIMGDGPTVGHISRLTAYDSTGAEQDSTQNWSFLPTVANSGFSIDQFAANQWIREFGKSNRKITGTVWTSATSSPPKPYHLLVFENPHNALTADYNWQSRLTYRLANHAEVLQGTFTEVQETVTADQLCTVDIKPNTALLAGVDLQEGLVCDDTADFVPNASPTHVYFSREQQYRKAAILDEGEWASEAIVDIDSSRRIDTVKVDEGSSYIFGLEFDNSTSNTKWLERYNIDGSNKTTLDSWASPDIWTASNIAIARISKVIFIMEQRTDTNGFRIRSIDYDGNTVDALIHNEPSTSGFGAGIGVSPDEIYIFWSEEVGGGGGDELWRHQLATGGNVSMGATTNDIEKGTYMDTILIDSDYAEGIFTNIEDVITRWNYPAGGGETTVTSNPTENAMGIDRSQQQLYYVNGASDDRIRRISYDGSGDEEVFDHDQRITSLDLGFN